MKNPLVLKNVNKTLSILRSSEDKLIILIIFILVLNIFLRKISISCDVIITLRTHLYHQTLHRHRILSNQQIQQRLARQLTDN